MNDEKKMLEEILMKLDKVERQLEARTGKTLPQLLTTEEAAEYLGVQKQTMCIWRTAGVGPGFRKIEKCVRYSMDDLEKYINQQAVNC